MIELKPCPFYGGQAEIISDYANAYYVECQRCWASFGEMQLTEKLAAEEWNSRTEPPTMVWLLHEENTGWECPNCHAVFELDGRNPKDKYLNFCPVCGTELELPD